MPLFKGKSKKAFGENVKTEMDNGKPQKQALAIAYNMKRKSGHAHGGTVECPKCSYPVDTSSKADPTQMVHMAEGGMLTKDGYQSTAHSGNMTHPDLADHEMNEYDEADYNKKRAMKTDAPAMTEDDRELNQHGAHEEGPTGQWMADGGMMTDDGYQTEAHDRDMVGRIMAQRQQMYSEGGRVANQDKITAGFKPNEFDDLHLRDDLEEHYTGANSGDELSDEGEDRRRRDMVSRIMASRKLRPGRNPRPA